jgi:hypothetical protein
MIYSALLKKERTGGPRLRPNRNRPRLRDTDARDSVRLDPDCLHPAQEDGERPAAIVRNRQRPA